MIIVFGSLNMDMCLAADRLPVPGETVICPAYEMLPGGKGANQALAASRYGGKVAIVGAVGNDGMGVRLTGGLKRAGVMTSGVGEAPDLPTGCAVIMRDVKGENQVMVATGANAHTAHDQIPDEILRPGNIVMMQMEVRPEENWALARRASARGATIILNCAPALPVPADVYALLDYIIMNETESARTPVQPGKAVRIVTYAERGAVATFPDGREIKVPALPVDVVDTTGAGDAWCGTFAACLHDKKPVETAMRHAAIAASLSCREAGAQSSYAYVGEIEENLPRLGA